MRCPGGASGHETDKVSAEFAEEREGIGEGPQPRRRRGGDADLRHALGRAVFSVGSINYVASLPVDENVSRITETCAAVPGEEPGFSLFRSGSVACGREIAMKITRIEAIPVCVPSEERA